MMRVLEHLRGVRPFQEPVGYLVEWIVPDASWGTRVVGQRWPHADEAHQFADAVARKYGTVTVTEVCDA